MASAVAGGPAPPARLLCARTAPHGTAAHAVAASVDLYEIPSMHGACSRADDPALRWNATCSDLAPRPEFREEIPPIRASCRFP